MENALSEPGRPFTMPRSREGTLDFSVQREAKQNCENQQGTAYCVRRSALRISTKKRRTGAVLYADFTWIEI